MAVMAKAGVRLHPHPSLSPQNSLLRPHTQNLLSHFNSRSIFKSNDRYLLLLRLSSRPLHVPRSRRWDSNAESYNTNKFNFDADDEGEEFDDDKMEQWAEALEDYIDSIWIFKVFGSFGWMLPPIILSLLLANGPKAFLLALALPIGQSTFAFAIQRFQNRGKVKPKVKNKNKKSKKGRSSRVYSSGNVKFEEEAEWIGSQGPRKKKKEYQSWVYKNDVNSVSSSEKTAANFGGWDELDAGMDQSKVGSSRRTARKSSGLRGKSAEKGKNGRLSKRDVPLLLRLLISIFSFLSSWTEVL